MNIKELLSSFISFFKRFTESVEYKTKKEGLVLVVEYKPDSLEAVDISKKIVMILKKSIRSNKRFITQNSEDYDYVRYSIMFLLSFVSTIGFRKEEYELEYISVRDLEEIDYQSLERKLILSLNSVMERYHIKEIECIVIKII